VYYSPNIIRDIKSRVMRGAGHIERMGNEKWQTSLVGNPEANCPLSRPRRECEVKFKTAHKERGWEDADWIYLSCEEGPVESSYETVINFRVPRNSGTVIFSFTS
jgi:hypothetical protein